MFSVNIDLIIHVLFRWDSSFGSLMTSGLCEPHCIPGHDAVYLHNSYSSLRPLTYPTIPFFVARSPRVSRGVNKCDNSVCVLRRLGLTGVITLLGTNWSKHSCCRIWPQGLLQCKRSAAAAVGWDGSRVGLVSCFVGVGGKGPKRCEGPHTF
jgi:hypothetical protein